MLKLDDVIQEILPETQNVPEETVKRSFRQAYREFCRRSKWWRVRAYAAMLDQDGHMKISLPKDTDLVHCFYVETPNHKRYNKVEKDGMHGMVTVQRTVSEDSGMAMIAVMPTMTVEEVDEDLYSIWADTLRSGTLYYLRSQFGREWFQQELATVHFGLFEDGIAKAVHDVQDFYKDSPSKARSNWL